MTDWDKHYRDEAEASIRAATATGSADQLACALRDRAKMLAALAYKNERLNQQVEVLINESPTKRIDYLTSLFKAGGIDWTEIEAGDVKVKRAAPVWTDVPSVDVQDHERLNALVADLHMALAAVAVKLKISVPNIRYDGPNMTDRVEVERVKKEILERISAPRDEKLITHE